MMLSREILFCFLFVRTFGEFFEAILSCGFENKKIMMTASEMLLPIFINSTKILRLLMIPIKPYAFFPFIIP